MTETSPSDADRAPDVDQPDGGGPQRDAEGTGRTPRATDVDQPDGGSADSDPADGTGRV